MRKPCDFDSELKALADKARQLKERRVQLLGELVIATGADATDAETLAGALLVIADTTGGGKKEAWRKRGAAFFQSKARKRGERTRQLFELGGLVVKARLVELADDDRATLYGAFLTVAVKLRGEDREQALVLWKRKRAFEAGGTS